MSLRSFQTALATPGLMGMSRVAQLSVQSDFCSSIKDEAAAVIPDAKFAERAQRYPHDAPDTKEAYWIRELFEHHFPSEAAAKTAVRLAYFSSMVQQQTLTVLREQVDPEAGVGRLVRSFGSSG